ncbi:low molecular weight protein-tyrosine-phosphatase [Cellulomonas sp. ATA003]|uniref:low molecular weight protein-tyrosine-phosphatase n=1 Tax=Cellulomonas sp. ATA003 TaxID=3073064 RepID=UPI002873B1EF|nr:low molecular weight protein-tyrosine-phosphatase [Cellulomonas sp. ATA003]WNB87615.1 low molecular weight protein-tyrosine-phosphatase [Cellulomonas sp. ATA003]
MTVCTGNICRSPMAEVVLRRRLDDAGLGHLVEVTSTGISDEEDGNPVDTRAQSVLRARGYEVPRRAARQVRATDLTGNDLVLAMTSTHARALRRLARTPELAGRVVMYRSFDPAAPLDEAADAEHLLDIADPWYGGDADFVECLDQVEAAADAVVDRVRADLAARGVTTG